MIRWYVIKLIAGCSFLASIAAFQAMQDAYYAGAEDPEFHYIPYGEFLRLTMPHLAQTAADAYWIKSVLFFGRRVEETGTEGMRMNLSRAIKQDSLGPGVMERKEFRMLRDMLKTVVDLDPYFEYPYLFGGLFLSLSGGMVEDAIEILRRGEKRFPDNWRFPFYIGFNLYFFRNDNIQALKEFVRAAVLPGRPAFLYTIIQTIAEKESRQETAESILQGAVLSTDNRQMQRDLEKLLSELRAKKAAP